MVLMRRVSSCSAALDWFDDHRPSQDDDNDLGDEDLRLLDDRKLGSSQISDSFEISSPDMKVDSPRFFKKPVDESGDDSKSNKYHYPSEASIRMASLNESDIEESADDDNDDAKSDFFEDSTQANSKYFDGKFVRRGSDFHIQDDEDYSMPHPTLPMPTSRTYKWQNLDEGDVMPYNSLSSSSGPSAYHLPLEKELSRGIVRGRLSLFPENSLTRHARALPIGIDLFESSLVEMKSKRVATRPPSTRVESTGYVGSEHVACHCVLSPLIRASILWGASSPSIHGGEISNSQRDQIKSTIIISEYTLYLK